MASGATEWAWQQSRARNTAFTVILAIADELETKGRAEMSVAELARKARSSDRAIQLAARELVALGELTVDDRAGDAGRNVYRLPMVDTGRTGEESAPVKNLQGEESAPVQTGHNGNAQVTTGEKSAPVSSFRDVLDLGSVVTGTRSKPSRPRTPPPDRPDVERLCQHLAERVTANGSRPPKIGKDWRDAARLLIDKDGITEERIHLAIDWSQQDHFWHRNILSMPTLRKQFDKLRLAALAEQREKSRQQRNSHQPTPDDINALRNNWAAPLDAMEAGNDTRGNGRPHPVHHGHLPPAED
jgi:hypothetical protein